MKLIFGVAIGVFLTLAMPAFAQQITPPLPAPVQPRIDVTLNAPPPDPTVVAESAVESSQAIVIGVVAPPIVAWDNQLLGLPDVWRQTPPDLTYNNKVIQDLADLVQLVSIGLIALALLAMGIAHSLGGGYPMQWGRLLLGIVMSVGNRAFWQIGIDTNNAINAAIRAPDVGGLASPHLQMPANPGQAFADVVMVVVFGLVLLLTLLSLLSRLGLIEVLIAAGSLMLLLFSVEQTAHWATGYMKVSFGTVFSQVLIVIGLVTAQVLGGLATGVVGALLAIVVLLLIRNLPNTMAGMGRQGGDGGLVGRLVSLFVLRRLAR